MSQIFNRYGYLALKLQNRKKIKTLKVHQLVLMAFLGHKPDGTSRIVVDHINNIKHDNRLLNLQLLSSRDNTSKIIRTNKKTSFIGVYMYYKSKYSAKISVKNKHIHLGTFETQEEASEYYQNAVKAIENGDKIIIKKRKTSSKHIGVTFIKKENRWRAYFKGKYIGLFKTEKEAYLKREEYIKNLNK